MSSIKKRQHYIWRNYLRPWSNDEKIWTLFKESKKIENTNLMNIGQEKYFYKLIEFNNHDEDFIKDFINRVSHSSVKDLNFDFFEKFTIHHRIRRLLESKKVPKKLYEEELRKIEVTTMENTHTLIENMGMKLISCRCVEDLKFLERKRDLYNAIMFLSFQYFRTKNIKNKVNQAFKGIYEAKVVKCWNIISYVLSMNIARLISLDNKLRFIFFENKSKVKFLTSDQPIFNILGDDVNEKGDVKELEFYYPLTPVHAISIHFRNDQKEKFKQVIINEDESSFFNNKVCKHADYSIFSDNKEQLKNINNWP